MNDVDAQIKAMLEEEGDEIIENIQNNLSSSGTNASGATSSSLHKIVEAENFTGTLSIFGRAFIMGVETGRGPRKSASESGFLDGMKDWMRIRGIGSGLTEVKFNNLARFFTWRQNKIGSKLFRSGGRKDIITPAISEEVVKKISDKAAKIYADNLFNYDKN